MKTETKKVTINHPDLGKLDKSITYTYDETKYKSLEECLIDHDKKTAELKEESERLTAENKKEVEKISLENEKLLSDCDEKFKKSFSLWENSLNEIQKEYEKKISDLQKEYKEKYENEFLKKPKKEVPQLKKPKLNWVDNKKYEGRGYISKEMAVAETPIDIVGILNSASKEQIEQIKLILK